MKQQQGGAVLPLEAGNSLFAEFNGEGLKGREKAELYVQTLAQLGVKVMGVGMRDLTLGPDYVKQLAAKHGVEPLSANLVKDGQPLFAPSKVLEVNGLRVGVIGVSPANPFGRFPGVAGKPFVPAVEAEAQKLRAANVDLVVVMAALPYQDALQLSAATRKSVDLIFQTHDLRGVASGAPQLNAGNVLLPTGERGRQVARVDVDLTARGEWVDAAQLRRSVDSLRIIERRIEAAQAGTKDAKDDATKASWARELQRLEERKAEVTRELNAGVPKDARLVALSFLHLGPEIAGDPKIAAAVDRLGLPASH